MPRLRSVQGHTASVYGWVYRIVVTPDSKKLVSASYDKILKIWDIESHQIINTLEGHSDGVKGLALTPEGRKIISGSADRTVRIWDFDSGVELKTLEGHKDTVNFVAVTPDNKYVISGGGGLWYDTGPFDSTIRLWDLETGAFVTSLQGHPTLTIQALAVTPDGQYLISIGDHLDVKVWELPDGKLVNRWKPVYSGECAFTITSDKMFVIAAYFKGHIRMWGSVDGNETHSLMLPTHADTKTHIQSIAAAPDRSCFVTTSQDKKFEIWDFNTGEQVSEFSIPDNATCSVITPDGKTAIAGGDYGHVHFLTIQD